MKIDMSIPARRLVVMLLAFGLLAGFSHAAAPAVNPAPREQASPVPEAPEAPESPAPPEAEEHERGESHDSGSDEFRFGQSVTVGAGEESHRNIVVYGGSVKIEGKHDGEITVFGGHVKIEGTQHGDVVVMGGGLEVSGKVEGSVAVIGGGAHLTSTANVAGDVSVVGGGLNRDPGAVLRGGNVSVAAPSLPVMGLPFAALGGLTAGITFFAWLKSALLTLLVGLIVAALLPARVEAAAVVLRERWLACLGVGFLAGVAVVPLMLILLITCVGVVIPPLAYQVAKYFGLTVLFIVVGEALGRAVLKRALSPIGSFLLGLAVLSLIGLVAPAWIVYGWFGVGCALLTRFGTMRPWFKKRTAAVPPTLPEPPETTPPPSTSDAPSQE